MVPRRTEYKFSWRPFLKNEQPQTLCLPKKRDPDDKSFSCSRVTKFVFHSFWSSLALRNYFRFSRAKTFFLKHDFHSHLLWKKNWFVNEALIPIWPASQRREWKKEKKFWQLSRLFSMRQRSKHFLRKLELFMIFFFWPRDPRRSGSPFFRVIFSRRLMRSICASLETRIILRKTFFIVLTLVMFVVSVNLFYTVIIMHLLWTKVFLSCFFSFFALQIHKR